jgi:hypothetical protein
VDIVDVTCVIVLPPVVCVKVTGHVVRVEMTISVVMSSEVVGDVAGEEPGRTDVGVMLDATVGTLLATGIEWVSVESGVWIVAGGDDPAGGEDWCSPGRDVIGQIVVEMAIVDVTTVVERAGQLVTSGPQLVIVISLVVNTVDVVKDGEVAGKVVGDVAGELVVGDGAELGVVIGLDAGALEALGTERVGVVAGLVAGVVDVLGTVLLGVEAGELGMLVGTELGAEVDAIVAIVKLGVLLGTLLVEEAVETVYAGVEADWQSKPTLWMPISQPESLPLSGIWKLTDWAPPHWSLVTVVPEAEQDAVCLQVEPSGMSKTKSRSVSKETETCIVVMEKSWPDPQAIFGALPASLLTDPWIHFDWKSSRRASFRRLLVVFVKELLHWKPEKPKPPKLLKEPVGRVDQSKPDCWSVVQLLLVLDGLLKACAVSQLSATACCRNRATKPAVNADFMIGSEGLSE